MPVEHDSPVLHKQCTACTIGMCQILEHMSGSAATDYGLLFASAEWFIDLYRIYLERVPKLCLCFAVSFCLA